MPRIEQVVKDLTLDRVLDPENQHYYYDPSLYVPGRDLTKEEQAKAICIPYYPVVRNPRQIDGDIPQNQIPVTVKNARDSGKMIGLLVSECTLFENLFVLIHEPTPASVELPTSVGRSLRPQQEFGPIQGFLVLKNAHINGWHQFMLMVGQDMSSVEAVSLGSLSKKRFLAGLLMRKVIKAQYIHESNSAKTGQNYANTMRLDA